MQDVTFNPTIVRFKQFKGLSKEGIEAASHIAHLVRRTDKLNEQLHCT